MKRTRQRAVLDLWNVVTLCFHTYLQREVVNPHRDNHWRGCFVFAIPQRDSVVRWVGDHDVCLRDTSERLRHGNFSLPLFASRFHVRVAVGALLLLFDLLAGHLHLFV